MCVRLKITLRELLNEKGITQKELSDRTGIRPATISELVNNQRLSIHKKHIEVIANELNVTDISDLIVLEECN